MELEASSVAVYDPGDPNLGEHQGSRSNDSGKQIPQELSLSEIMPFEASHESSGIPDQECQQVESRDLSTLHQLRAKKMPTDSPPPKRKSVDLFKPHRGDVTCDEVISILRESQLDELGFGMADYSEEDGSIEAYREDRLHLFDAIGKCESLKSIKIAYMKQLHVEEILLLRPALEEHIEGLDLNISGFDQRSMTILCEMLAKNNVLKDVSFEVDDGQLAVLCEILPTLHTFKPILHLHLSEAVTISGAASFVSILGMNSIVRTLAIDDRDNLLGSNGLEMILDPLIGHLGNPPANQSVNILYLNQCDIGRDGGAIKAVVEMLRTNNTLMKLYIYHHPTLKPVMILDPLTGHSGNPPLNQSLKELVFVDNNIGGDGGAIKAIAEMLRTNTSLTKFSIEWDYTLKPSDVCTLLSSLENNQSLRELGFTGCQHVGGADVLGKMMDLLRVNPWLTQIGLSGTRLQREGQAAQVRAQLERNAQDYMKVVRGMPRVPPRFTKVFLCGNAYSGKTTLRRSMARSLEKGVGAHLIPLVEIIELRKPFKCCFNDPNEWDKRTRGINIKVLVDNHDMKVSIWDLAGQEEYHAFHDMMLQDLSTQGNVCYFLLVCNPFLWDQSRRPKTPQELEDEFSYWLRFISSNTKRSSNFAPQVTIVLTNNDQEYIYKQFVDPCVRKLKARFVDFINLSSNTYSINAHSSREAKQVLKDVTTTCKNVLEKLPKVYEICLHVQLDICQWIKEHPNQPIVSMQIFEQEIFAKNASRLQVIPLQLAQRELEKPHIAIAMFLHDAGEIIYFKNEDFVVLNLNWFCQKVMGHLIKLRGYVENANLAKTFPNGFGEMEHLEILLELSLKDIANLVGLKKDEILNYLVRLMVKMDFAYEDITLRESSSQSVKRLFVPTTLQLDESVTKGERRLKWTSQFSSDAEVIYMGQRLQCGDQDHTTLTPGFFPRIQVALHNYFNANWKHGELVNERNLMRIWRSGLEILIELSGDEMGGDVFIDVLVKSAKTKLETFQLVNDHVLSQIEHLCSVAQGCQGVALVRGVLRPKVVQNLMLCKNRKNQTVLVEVLKQELVEDLKRELLVENFELSQCVHTWPQVDVPLDDRDYLSISMDDKVTSLLGELQTLEVLERHFRHLKNAEMDVDNIHVHNMSMENGRDVFQSGNERLDVKPQGSFRPNSSKISNNLERRDISNNDLLVEMRSMKTEIIDGFKQELQSMEKRLENRITHTCEEIRMVEQTLYGKVTMKVDGIMNLILQLEQRQVPCNFYFTTPGTKCNRQLIMKLLSGMEIVHLHLLCEHVDGIHVVEKQKGVEIKLSTLATREKINRLIMASLTVLSLLVKVGAHVAAGIGNMIPDVAQIVALTCDTESLNDYLPDSKGSNHQSIIRNLPTSSDALIAMQGNGKKAAEQWLVNLLKGKEILDLFTLRRVKYVKITSCSEAYPIRWVCEQHWKEGIERGTLENCAFKPT
ncbi:hypothetical protein CY35_03G015000 [Sphagnum magellanicum]|nr:hypothetical protein CY35_03G015000 [Sphagnum magellanicum]